MNEQRTAWLPRETLSGCNLSCLPPDTAVSLFYVCQTKSKHPKHLLLKQNEVSLSENLSVRLDTPGKGKGVSVWGYDGFNKLARGVCGGEKEREIDLLFHLVMHSLVASCMCPDWGSNS